MSTLTLSRHQADRLRVGDRIVAIDGRPLDTEMEVAATFRRIFGKTSGVPLVNPLGTDTRWVLYPDSQVEATLLVERVEVVPAAPMGTSTPGTASWASHGRVEPAEAAPEPIADSPAVAERRAKLDERLRNLAKAVSSGASNPPLIKRAGRIADEIADEHPDLAQRLRTALTTRWEGLGNRYDKIHAIRKELATRPLAEPIPAPAKQWKPQRQTRYGLTLVGGNGYWETEDGRYVVQYDDEFLTECEEPHPVRLGRAGTERLRRLLAEHGERWFVSRHGPGQAALDALRQGKRGYYCPGGEEHTYGMWAAWRGDANWDDLISGGRYETRDEAWAALASYLARQRDGEG